VRCAALPSPTTVRYAPGANGVLDIYAARTSAQGDSDSTAAREIVERELRLVAIAAERSQLQRLWSAREIQDVLHTDVLHQLAVAEEGVVGKPARGHGHVH